MTLPIPLTSAPRTQCDPGEGPLWCFLLGGIPVSEWRMLNLLAAQRQLMQEMKYER